MDAEQNDILKKFDNKVTFHNYTLKEVSSKLVTILVKLYKLCEDKNRTYNDDKIYSDIQMRRTVKNYDLIINEPVKVQSIHVFDTKQLVNQSGKFLFPTAFSDSYPDYVSEPIVNIPQTDVTICQVSQCEYNIYKSVSTNQKRYDTQIYFDGQNSYLVIIEFLLYAKLKDIPVKRNSKTYQKSSTNFFPPYCPNNFSIDGIITETIGGKEVNSKVCKSNSWPLSAQTVFQINTSKRQGSISGEQEKALNSEYIILDQSGDYKSCNKCWNSGKKVSKKGKKISSKKGKKISSKKGKKSKRVKRRLSKQ
jgi:hypothetical protein